MTDARRSVPGMCSDRCGGVVSAEPIGDDEWAKVIKKRAEAAGLDPALFSGHSMRAGLPYFSSRGWRGCFEDG